MSHEPGHPERPQRLLRASKSFRIVAPVHAVLPTTGNWSTCTGVGKNRFGLHGFLVRRKTERRPYCQLEECSLSCVLVWGIQGWPRIMELGKLLGFQGHGRLPAMTN
jgi:hypothetical protein